MLVIISHILQRGSEFIGQKLTYSLITESCLFNYAEKKLNSSDFDAFVRFLVNN